MNYCRKEARKRLVEKGFSDEQAWAIAQIVYEKVVVKDEDLYKRRQHPSGCHS